MSKDLEVAVEIDRIRKGLLSLMEDAHKIDDHLREVNNTQASLKASIMLSLDYLDRAEKRLRLP